MDGDVRYLYKGAVSDRAITRYGAAHAIEMELDQLRLMATQEGHKELDHTWERQRPGSDLPPLVEVTLICRA